MPDVAGASFDSDALLQQSRILADGGSLTDLSFLSSFITDLKAGPGNCYTLLNVLFIPIAIKKDGADKVSRFYDLSTSKSGSYYDITQSNASLQQTWQDNQIDGKPWVMFDSSLSGYAASGVASIAQPATTWVICRKDGGGSTHRLLLAGRTAGAGPNLILYANNATNIAAYPGTSDVTVATNQATLGQFTVLLSGASSNIRRKGASLGTGGSGTQAVTQYVLGADFNGTLPHSGPIAFCATARQSVSTAQRDHIEGLLNSTYYPSTV